MCVLQGATAAQHSGRALRSKLGRWNRHQQRSDPGRGSLFVSSARTVQSLPLLCVNHWLRCCSAAQRRQRLIICGDTERRSSRGHPRQVDDRKPAQDLRPQPSRPRRIAARTPGRSPSPGRCEPKVSTRRRSRSRVDRIPPTAEPRLATAAPPVARRRSRRCSRPRRVPHQPVEDGLGHAEPPRAAALLSGREVDDR